VECGTPYAGDSDVGLKVWNFDQLEKSEAHICHAAKRRMVKQIWNQ
jgi:hypothetical protein